MVTTYFGKASRTLNFLKRNLRKCSSQVKESAYLTMVRPQLEYATDVWVPHYVGDIMELENVQWRAAHWMLNDYGRFSSVTSMLDQLSWPTLQTHCKISRLHSYMAQSFLSSVITYNASILLTSRAEQLINLIDNRDYWEIINVMIIIVISIIDIANKKSHQKLNYTGCFDTKCSI